MKDCINASTEHLIYIALVEAYKQNIPSIYIML